VAAALARIQQGNLSNAKGIGGWCYEFRIDSGPGYRIYFGQDGDCLVILVGGGTKERQKEDIKTALARWQDYKLRKVERGITSNGFDKRISKNNPGAREA